MKSPEYLHRTSISFIPHKLAFYYKWLHQHWFEVLIGFVFIHLLIAKDVKISFQFKEKAPIAYTSPAPKAQQTALFESWDAPKTVANTSVPKAQSFYNLTFILSPDYADRKGVPLHIVQEKKQVVQNYIDTYLKTAREEQAIYKIPVSITLAQGLLESNAGDSRLSKESNNHFGIKCKSKCKGCTCRNYHDDDYYDMFRVFDNPWQSYREHSILLSGSRYKHLKNFGNNYEQWSHGLKKAGYATDKKYADKLIKIIETLRLYQYD